MASNGREILAVAVSRTGHVLPNARERLREWAEKFYVAPCIAVKGGRKRKWIIKKL